MIWILMVSPRAGVLSLHGAFHKKGPAYAAAGIKLDDPPSITRHRHSEHWQDENGFYWRLERVELK